MAPTVQGPITFADRLKTLALGAFNDEATEEMDNLIGEMARLARTTGGKPKGQLSIKLGFKLDGEALDITYDLQVKRPVVARARAVLFVSESGELSDTNRRQLDAFEQAPARDVTEDRNDRSVRIVD